MLNPVIPNDFVLYNYMIAVFHFRFFVMKTQSGRRNTLSIKLPDREIHDSGEEGKQLITPIAVKAHHSAAFSRGGWTGREDDATEDKDSIIILLLFISLGYDPTDSPKSGKILIRPDPRVHPTRGQLCSC